MEIDKQKIAAIAQKHGLELLLLFGSRASGKIHPMSDFDFGFSSKKELGYKQKAELGHDLAKLVEFSDVESVDLKKISPLLLKEIVKNNQVIFEEAGCYADFFSRATRKYFEAKPIFKLQETLYHNAINKYQKKYAQ